MHFLALAQVLILLSLANASPVIAKLFLGKTYARPIDGNTRFIDGRPLFGPSKTIRGLVVSLLLTALAAPLIGLQFKIGLLVAAAAMAGDFLSSFSKRGWVLHPVVRRPGSTKFQKRSSVTRLPFCIFVNGDRYRGGLCDLFCGRSIALLSLFSTAAARPSLLTDLCFRTSQAMQCDFREAVEAHCHDRRSDACRGISSHLVVPPRTHSELARQNRVERDGDRSG